ncbi:MAG: NADH:ubiquinone reductase (Na(+)-transporting) subunit D [Clostridia bacterium]|nr:NADH:ubiquinone reductase (Na(+)-transporting) subunit D [Eubacteriales bacterium]MDD3867111.1 NADH:ubiquinone reductase (Na(+)-transporting) subunit D [Eubacteriales bacterium]MDD4462398.1 NADH:ubiquinone reductase (Na(+)-transporting) subunit D [Eubacteriales bacterium]NCC48926.1 NADH:ubiquinone reductase (Na(+)-transporting) subunit D [Clostridia bacterium]
MAEGLRQVISRNVWKDNQVLRQILGICSSLAVTNLMTNSLVMGLGLTFVTTLSSLTISMLRNLIPHRIRMIVQTLIIASYVILVDIFLKANLPDISKALGPYVGLIITNCIIMGRAEAYAQKNPPLLSAADGLFAGIGYTLVLLIIAFIREFLGFGSVFGWQIPFLNFEKWTIMVMPPAAFFIIGVLIWVMANLFAPKSGKKS